MAYLQTKMHEETGFLKSLGSWLFENWEKILWFGVLSQFIDRFFKWLTKRSEARIKEIMKDEIDISVKPEIKNLTASIDGLKESIWELKSKIK